MVARIVMGNNSGVYSLKISKPGYDVTSTSAENLLFDSSADFMRVRIIGSIAMSSSDTVVAIPISNIGVTGGLARYVSSGVSVDAADAGYDYELDASFMYIKRRSGTSGSANFTYAIRSEVI